MHTMTDAERLAIPDGFEAGFMGDVEVGDIVILKRFVSNQKFDADDYLSGHKVLMYAVERVERGTEYREEELDYETLLPTGNLHPVNRVDNFILRDEMDLQDHWSCGWRYPCYIYRP